MKNQTITNAIAANIAALTQLLDDATACAHDAHQAMAQNEQNMAIGSIADLDHKLEDALALYRAAVALHRTRGAS